MGKNAHKVQLSSVFTPQQCKYIAKINNFNKLYLNLYNCEIPK